MHLLPKKSPGTDCPQRRESGAPARASLDAQTYLRERGVMSNDALPNLFSGLRPYEIASDRCEKRAKVQLSL